MTDIDNNTGLTRTQTELLNDLEALHKLSALIGDLHMQIVRGKVGGADFRLRAQRVAEQLSGMARPKAWDDV